MNSENIHYIDDSRLTVGKVAEILASGARLEISEGATARIDRCRRYLDEKMASCREPLYGINTGFGSLCNITVGSDDLGQLQKNLVMSHSCGTGEPVDPEIVRLMLFLKAQSLSYGNSGVQVVTVQRLLDFYNLGIIPVVYSLGSLGASGDLAPLANMCLPLIGLGEVWYKNQRRPAAEVLAETGLEPVQLQSKEGLALLNGTQFMSAHAVKALIEAERLWNAAERIGAMSLDAFDGRIEPFGPEVNEVRHHPGQIEAARVMRGLLAGSQLIARPKAHVQDPYSFRCIPQVHGAVLDAIMKVRQTIEDEINSPTDNPTIFPDRDIIVSAGNFHGEPIALPMDYLTLAMSELANISERRIYKLIAGVRDLPSFLVARPGLNSGFMILQYTAASIVNRNKCLCWPTSCDSIPSSQGQEDHVSMGANSAVKLLQVVDNVRSVLALELINAAQALDFRRPLRSSEAVEKLHADFRRTVPFIEVDTVMSPHIAAATEFVRNM